MEKEEITFLLKKMRAIYAFVPESRRDLDRWYDMAKEIQHWIAKSEVFSSRTPHFLWHYLSDADLRFKDKNYAAMQNARIKILLDYLSRGVIPEDKDLDLRD